jgi:lipopolysaccharide transport system ATP-binding protein
MAREIAISVKNLGKQYRIGMEKQNDSLRDAITYVIRAPFNRLKDSFCSNNTTDKNNYIWALKDVSFDVEYGKVIGIIGRNGSGKSTLLKILSRITYPTEGSAEIHGRIGSLLEVGTGFHPDLTGRENIFLSGSILGMKRREIDDKFDDIVKFSEIEKFIDTPVKRYSSGMYVRLAFAVAAHLDPEILLVDEVLAVGDAAFQKKCLGKMNSVSKEGRTILFVSHNMGAIINLCNSTIWLENGQLRMIGDTQSVVNEYLHSGSQKLGNAKVSPPPQPSDVIITDCFVFDNNSQISTDIDFRYPFFIGLGYSIKKFTPGLSVSVALKNDHGVRIIFTSDADRDPNEKLFENVGTYQAYVEIPGHFLHPGRYYVDLGAEVPNSKSYHYAHECLNFDVIATGLINPEQNGWGVVCPKLNWKHEYMSNS